ncbi:MAG TPA: nuclear transport factor 2 family protein [Chryseolinea sp.]|nr:nuclear transport factor 2 family protein [Chryseolinea sp.]
MNDNETLIHRFYSAFQNKDYTTMQSLYHPQAHFSDPVFTSLDSSGVKAMWQMLVTAGKDLRITFQDVKADDKSGSCHWEAWYTFSRTGKKVHNIIDASFEFKDGLILNHKDRFDFWRWSRQALGLPGWLLGWSPLVKNKVRNTASSGLRKFIQR